jgi:hypothetical protein
LILKRLQGQFFISIFFFSFLFPLLALGAWFLSSFLLDFTYILPAGMWIYDTHESFFIVSSQAEIFERGYQKHSPYNKTN